MVEVDMEAIVCPPLSRESWRLSRPNFREISVVLVATFLRTGPLNEGSPVGFGYFSTHRTLRIHMHGKALR